MPVPNVVPRILGWSALIAGIGLLAASTYVGWVLKDGLGPDAVTTQGWPAISNFLVGAWPFLAAGVALSAAGGTLLVRTVTDIQ